MKKLILFTLLSVLSLVGFSQSFGRLKIHSGLYDNYVINGSDTSIFGWRGDRFSLGTDNAKSLEFLLNGIHSGLIDSTFDYMGRGGATHFGYKSGQKDTTYGNTFYGYFSGKENTSGFMNVAIGALALSNNITGEYNTAIGQGSMKDVKGGWNTAVGQASLASNITGYYNTIIGEDAYQKGTSGSYNTSLGSATLNNCFGNYNTALGNHSGNKLTTGSYNLFLGNYAGYYGNWNYKGFIDAIDRNDSASQLTSSPVVIDFNPTPSLQNVRINGDLHVNNLQYQSDSLLVVDEASIVLSNGISGWGEVYVFDTGTIAEWAEFIFSSDGTVYLKSNSTTVVSTDTDTKFCIFDNGGGVTIRNRLGGSRTVKYIIHH